VLLNAVARYCPCSRAVETVAAGVVVAYCACVGHGTDFVGTGWVGGLLGSVVDLPGLVGRLGLETCCRKTSDASVGNLQRQHHISIPI
jgi:hypothetical protein